MTQIRERILMVYSVVLTLVLTVVLLSGAAGSKSDRFDEITVQRINVVEPDGTLRMVISNHAHMPGVIVRGKERPPEDRPQAGMIFYNDEGTENGGLIFGGHKNEKGEVIDSGGSLSFDKYEANQLVQLAGVEDKENRFAGLSVTDSPRAGESNERVWVGRGADGVAVIALKDEKGRKRISIEVPSDGTPRLVFLNAEGKVIDQIMPGKKE